jgi:c-di-GMP-binding flagellar brake protein YcgR
LEERRSARRYKLALQIEIRLESNVKEFELILGRIRDISTHGFYFRSDQGLSAGMKFWFSIMPPWEVAQGTHAFISGRARAVRVEEGSESHVDRVGVAAIIERYKFGQTESSAYLTGSGL